MDEISLRDPNSDSVEKHGTFDENDKADESHSPSRAKGAKVYQFANNHWRAIRRLNSGSEEEVEEGSIDYQEGIDLLQSVITLHTSSHPQYLADLEDLVSSDYIHNRQLAAKKIVESLQEAGTNQNELQLIISVICKLSEDEEALVRSELVQNIPAIALHCHNRPGLDLVITQQLVPYIVKLLGDNSDWIRLEMEMRKLAQSTLLELMTNNLIGHLQLSEWICPLIAQFATNESNLEKPEDIIVMFRMIPLVPRDVTIKYFLEPFVALCEDEAYGIRTLCAMQFSVLCSIVGREITELLLLPPFLNLCSDSLWDVKKACAGVFVDVAFIVSPKTRKEVLLHVFIDLLDDTSHYVQFAACRSLGGFIFSFADPSKTGFTYVDSKLQVFDLDLVETPPKEPISVALESPEFYSKTHSGHKKMFRKYSRRTKIISDNCNKNISDSSKSFDQLTVYTNTQTELSSSSKNACSFAGTDNNFNNFLFWRTPLPEIELNTDIAEEHVKNIRPKTLLTKDPADKVSSIYSPDSNLCVFSKHNATLDQSTAARPTVSNLEIQAACINSIHPQEDTLISLDDSDVSTRFKKTILSFKEDDLVVSESENSTLSFVEENIESSTEMEMTPDEQDIVPPELLSRFVSHANLPLLMNSDEREGYCAINFPAVVLTLGRKYWPVISGAFKTLAGHMNWKVRKTIASALHELATILGKELTKRDLLPVFLELMKDVNEVRISVVTRLSEFLEHLWPIQDKDSILPLIKTLSTLDNDTNWRFRLAVAEHLSAAMNLFDESDVYDYFLPVALSLLRDRVSAVRNAAVDFMADIIIQLCNESELDKEEELFEELEHSYRLAHTWRHRQTYVMLCEKLAQKNGLPLGKFMEEFLPRMFSLAWDVVPNIRMAVARCIAQTLLPGFLPKVQEHVTLAELLPRVIHSLQSDMDRDVRQFMQLSTQTNCKKTPDCELFCCNKRYCDDSSVLDHSRNTQEPLSSANKKHKFKVDQVSDTGGRSDNMHSETSDTEGYTTECTNACNLEISFEDSLSRTPVESCTSGESASIGSNVDCVQMNNSTAEIFEELSPI